VVAISIILTVVSVISLMPLLQAQHLTNAYNTTIGVIRQARDNAISQRTSYSVTFATVGSGASAINTITLAPTDAFGNQLSTTAYQLPTDVWFLVGSGVSGVQGPDGFGTSATAIDFGYTTSGGTGGSNVIYFCPDGSAQTASTCSGSGNFDSGAVYLNGPVAYVNGTGSSPTGYALNSRAISLWGATGRIHGWRAYAKGTSYQWVRQ
jgi:Tfp pilus assembly protein FimT